MIFSLALRSSESWWEGGQLPQWVKDRNPCPLCITPADADFIVTVLDASFAIPAGK
jgi:hypothetical protein